MRLRHALFVAVILASVPARAQVIPPVIPPAPTQWDLLQNDPDPFCSTTRVVMTVPHTAHVKVEVRDPVTDEVLRTLVDSDLVVGVFAVIWDGRDANAVPVGNASYPYRMTATDAQSNLLFQATRFAQRDCIVGAAARLWEQVKQLYR